MARVLVPLACGFEEIEAITVIDVLRRAGHDVIAAGLGVDGPITGARGVRVEPDGAFDGDDRAWDLVVLPGGMGGVGTMAGSLPLLALLRDRVEAGLPVAAICAAPLVLDRAGVLTPGRFTCYPGVEAQIRTPGRVDAPIVDAGAVITSQGPGTAMAFALHLVGRLADDAAREQVAAALLAG